MSDVLIRDVPEDVLAGLDTRGGLGSCRGSITSVAASPELRCPPRPFAETTCGPWPRPSSTSLICWITTVTRLEIGYPTRLAL
jgi:hypothetical protein